MPHLLTLFIEITSFICHYIDIKGQTFKANLSFLIFPPIQKEIVKSVTKSALKPNSMYIRNIAEFDTIWPTIAGNTDPPIEPQTIMSALILPLTSMYRSKNITKFPNKGAHPIPTNALKTET